METHDSPEPVSDPLIDEIRDVRRRISQRFDHDPRKLVEHYRQMQEQYQDRLVGHKESLEEVIGRVDH